jgi:hypothetical protein
VFLPLSAGTIGFAAGGETFDIGGAQEVGWQGQLAQERGLALAQDQSGSAAELVYLSQYVGEDIGTGWIGKKKETAPFVFKKTNLLTALKTKS